MFNTSGPFLCPACPPLRTRKGRVVGPYLELTERNYSGCGVDMVNCPECGKGFCVSYKVDKIERDEAWDGPSRSETEAEDAKEAEEAKKAKVAEALAVLKDAGIEVKSCPTS